MADDDKVLQYLKRTTLELYEVGDRLKEVEQRQREPIAIVGMSCRYPGGASSPEELWRLVASEGDAIGEFPADRGWDVERLYDPDPDHRGTSYTRRGGFLYDAGEFDEQFFGMAPREALAIDPQQRLLLEGVWEALEDAGIDPNTLRGSQTGVFAGVIPSDYGSGSRLAQGLEGYMATGSTLSVVSGRVAYTFGFEGSAVTVDTACSSSLVAIHLACQALRQDECSLAVAGGVTVMATPDGFIEFSRQRGLAQDGRCKAFGQAADGMGASEGVGVVVLERLSEAVRLGHRPLALIRGSAVNQDGASNGLTAPNGPSQVRVIRQALASAGLVAGDVDVVEGHGTGTALGDPIEAGALIEAYGEGRSGAPLWLGSVKSNIGHTQAAAGVAGVVKMVMALRHGVLPRSLHIDEPSGHVDWSLGGVELLREAVEWSGGGRPRRAGVSSFGISGTNAHLILEEAPRAEDQAPEGSPELGGGVVGGGVLPFVVSGVSSGALGVQAGRLREFVAGSPDVGLGDVGGSLVLRAGLSHRAVVVTGDREDLLERLDVLARGGEMEGVVRGVARGKGRVAFVFSGQGSQWPGMGRDLYEGFPVFARAFDEACGELDGYLEHPLKDVLFADDGLLFEETRFAQPALFAVMVGLAALWRSMGVEPAFVVGHSQGEIAAAYIAGALSLADAARVVALRARALSEELEGKGGMVSISLPSEEVEALIGEWGERLSLATVNGPSSAVVSGEPDALQELVVVCGSREIRAKQIPVAYASHSEQIESIRDRLLEELSGIEPRASQVPFYSSVTGSMLDTGVLDGEYWYRNLRSVVRFEEATRSLVDAGCDVFLEVSPHPVLGMAIEETLDTLSDDRTASVLGSLRREDGGMGRFVRSLAEAYVDGVEVDWAPFFTGTSRVALPTYAFQRKRFWLSRGVGVADASSLGFSSAEHPLLGGAVELAGENEGVLFTGRLSLESHPWLKDHALGDIPLLPGTAFLELALAAGQNVGAEIVEELTLERPLVLGDSTAQLQISLTAPDEQGRREVAVYSRPENDEDDSEWVRHASGVLGSAEASGELESFGDEPWPPADAVELDTELLYERLAEAGYVYGPAFQGLRRVWRSGDDLFAEVALDEEQQQHASSFVIHPGLFDSALHALALAPQDGEAAELQVPFSFTGMRLHARGTASLRVRITPTAGDAASVLAVDSGGNRVFSVHALKTRPIDQDALRVTQGPGPDALFSLQWTQLPAESSDGHAQSGLFLEDLGSLQATSEESQPTPGVVLVRAGTLEEKTGVLEGDGPALVARALCGRLLELLQTFLAQEHLSECRLVVLTDGALTVSDGEVPNLVQAALVGLMRSAHSEHPERFALIDLDGSDASEQALGHALASNEPELALRGGTLYAPRLVRFQRGSEEDARGSLDVGGTVLITGGTGGLGALVARHLAAAHGARSLLLMSRSGPHAQGARELREELEAVGAQVRIVACDAADKAQLERLLSEVPEENPLTAVIHAAGVLDDGLLSSLDEERLERVFAPKVSAAVNLHELTEHLGLSDFVLYSSAAAILGSPGQGNYAAANAFLDALAGYRRSKGLPGLSLAWGAWEMNTGMTTALSDGDRKRFTRLGLTPLNDAYGLELFDTASAADESWLAPMPLDTRVLRAQAKAGLLPQLLSSLIRTPTRRAKGADGSLAGKLAAVPEAEWDQITLEVVREHVAMVLGHASADAVDPGRSFKELGFDSLSAIEIRNRLAQATGLKLPSTLIFDHPTPQAAARFLRERAGGQEVASRRVVRTAVRSDEPIAIVGMSCRYPGGASSPEELWRLVACEGDAIDGFPADRGWDVERLYDPDPDHRGTSYTDRGGFLYDAGEFDADFFGISPREALAIDPQQRLLLESSWEALEDAGIDAATLRGSQTGVFAGVMYQDYGLSAGSVPAELEGYMGTSVGGGVISGRIAYTFGFEGSALTVDTACSSSLVAIHLACQALRQGECGLALAGGVTVMSTPGVFIDFSRQRGLAQDGRCKAYAEAADGTGLSEGVGVVLLERLSEARRLGHRPLALIRGSAVNQDGASNGLTAPNGPSQVRVIRQALASAGLVAGDVDVVEGHGTGTALGDPIEAGALIEAYGGERSGGPLWLGSVKSNIGHAQAAAGVAGVVKMVMALRHGVLPRSLHIDEPSGHVDWSDGGVELLREAVDWPGGGRPRRAGVSSFGISGTNAHLILEEAPEVEGQQEAEAGGSGEGDVLPFVVSGGGVEALGVQAERLHSFLVESPDVSLGDVGGSLALHRTGLSHRAVVIADGREGLLERLDVLAHGAETEGVVRGVARGRRKVAFVFSGQGCQWEGMGAGLLASSAVFAEQVQACSDAFTPHLDFSVKDVLCGVEGAPSLGRIEVLQPVLFAVMVGLAALWRSVGVEPGFVVGHSQGEIAAAHVAGALSLQDAVRVVAVRSGLIARLADKGAMVSVAASAEGVASLVERFEGRVSLAVVNSPSSVVLACERGVIGELLARCETEDLRAREVPATVPTHSAHVEVLREELLEGLAGIEPRASRVPFYSTVAGSLLDTSELDGEYWYRNLRGVVLFEEATRGLVDAGCDAFLEVSPHPVLGVAVEETLDALAGDRAVSVLGSLRRGEGGMGRFVRSAAEAYVDGVGVDWSPFFVGSSRVGLPTYAFQRRRFWLSAGPGVVDASSLGFASAEHPLLGGAVELAGEGEGVLFTGRLSLESHPWLKDHALGDVPLLPGTAFLELALAAGQRVGMETVEELVLERPLLLEGQGAVQVQLSLAASDEQGRRGVVIYSRPEGNNAEDGGGEWARHATGVLSGEESSVALEGFGEESWPPVGAVELDTEFLYDRLAEAGYVYGPVFQGLQRAWHSGDDLFVEVLLDEEQQRQAGAFVIHPALFDSALHALVLGVPEGESAELRVPFSFTGVRLRAQGAASLRVRITQAGEAASIYALDLDGAPVFSVDALKTRPIDQDALRITQRSGHDALFSLQWTQLPAESSSGHVLDGAFLEDLGSLQAAVAAGQPTPGLILIRARTLEEETGVLEGGGLARTVSVLSARLLELLQTFLAQEHLSECRLALLTDGALAVSDYEAPNLAHAALVGLMRSADSEHPGRFALIDLDSSDASQEGLNDALASNERELAVRDGALYVPRLVRAGVGSSLVPPVGEGPWCLGVGSGGTLEGLSLSVNPGASGVLLAGQVRVAVSAAGLNFRDVLIALGVYPGVGRVGAEGAGVVLEVASDVVGLVPGDRVMGLMADAFGPVGVTDHRSLVRVPDGWSFEQAASVPTVFLTAFYGLVDLAGLQRGEALLVHGAAGGVGMAALQLAKHLGVEVFATAHPDKWATLRELDVEEGHVASSRDAGFREQFLERTSGRGVDVVLDSLAGDLVDASLDLLPGGGRFIEMGKTDIRDPEQIAESHPGVRYQAFDLAEAGPERIQEMLKEIVGLFERGVLEHLPVTSFDVRRAPEAFRLMREARHVGKIVLTVPQPADTQGTVLITGGTGGLGALLARHLVSTQGARSLLLLSRSGPSAQGAGELQGELEALGARVRIVACDAAERGQLEKVLGEIPVESPLTTVIHAAGVLDDGLLSSLDEERLQRVFAPKVTAAVNLHELTEHLGLSDFVLYSSAAAILGSPGQGNYAAANAFLDALAGYRRAKGLPGLSLAWGAWEMNTSMTSALSEGDRARFTRLGLAPITDMHGLQLFDTALAADESWLAPMPVDTRVLRSQAKEGLLPPLLGSLVRTPTRRAKDTSGSLAKKLASTPEAEWPQITLSIVKDHVAAVLGHSSPEAIDPGRPFKELGFDSLSAVELRNRLAQATGLKLPSTLVFDHPTPHATAHYLQEQAGGQELVSKAVVHIGARSEEPIAIVGMSCRYPGGASSPEELWRLIACEGDAIGEFPGDRGWDVERLYDPDSDHRGTSYTRQGGFLYDAGEFDGEFFGISPREALAIDPQQRLLLEGAWEALEDAGIDPDTLKGSQTGVFAGAFSSGYGFGSRLAQDLEGYLATGSTTSVVSGRIAYTFDFEGPAVTVDTACSSSLVAIHLACQALRQGECGLALAGGVTVMTSPGVFLDFSRQRGLAQDGRCKAFGQAADGTGLSEGVGVVVLERLSEARRLGHRPLALIRGSAVNQDGASNGLTAPNGPSQVRVIRQALANAGLSAGDVDAVEAHGTGTALGDPIEAQALISTYGQERSGAPLWLGSVKSNIGHTQAAAGVAGVMKMVMAMRHGVLPRSLHIDEPSSHVEWSEGEVELLREAVEWSGSERPRRAGVSAFGISGTNAHLILEEAPAEEQDSGDASVLGDGVVGGSVLPFVVSGDSVEALGMQAGRLREFLVGSPDVGLGDVGGSLALHRAGLSHRAVVIADGREGLLERLDALERGGEAEGVVRGVARGGGRVAFVFSGQGCQWEGMAAGLLGSSEVFAGRVGACSQAFAPYLDFSLEDVLCGVEGAPSLGRIEVLQPVLFAVMVGLAGLWRSLGVEPAFVVGHSQGEIAAAHVAGALSLQDAARVVAVRSGLIARLAGKGAMVSVAASAERAASLVEHFDGRASLAVVNSPASVVLACERGIIDEVLARSEAEGLRAREVPATVPTHSAHVEVLREELSVGLAGIEPCSSAVPFYSTVAGSLLDTVELDGEYWYRNLRGVVQFEQATRDLVDAGCDAFLEVSPHPVLGVAVEETLDALAGDRAVSVLGSLRRGEGDIARFARSAAEAFVGGIAVDWSPFFMGSRRVTLPTYAFQRRRFWLPSGDGVADASSLGFSSAEHPLLGGAVELAGEGEGVLFTGRLSLESHPWLRDHALGDVALLPGTAFLELALAAGGHVGVETIEELVLERPLVLEEGDAVRVQLSLAEADEQGRRVVAIYSCPDSSGEEDRDGEWVRHASGVLGGVELPAAGVAGFESGVWPPVGAVELDTEFLYDRLAEAGYVYGPVFQGLRQAWRTGEDFFVEVALDDEQQQQARAFVVHPALFDSALHALVLGAPEGEGAELQVPFSFTGMRLHAQGASSLRVRITQAGEVASLYAFDLDGAPVFSVDALKTRPIDQGTLRGRQREGYDELLSLQWTELPTESSNGRVLDGVFLEDLGSLQGAVAEGQPTPGLILIRARTLEEETGVLERDGLARTVSVLSARLLGLLQTFLAEEHFSETRLVLLTDGALAVSDHEAPNLAQAALVGLMRSAHSEHPGRFALIDLDDSDASQEALNHALASSESELALRGGTLYAPRLARVGVGGGLVPPVGEAAWCLGVGAGGTLEGLGLGVDHEASGPLLAGQVRVAVAAAGLNFRDVLIALGVYPGVGRVGAEGAGVVLEVASDVEGLMPGDRVMGLMQDAFGPVGVTDHRTLVKIPEGWSFEQAASVPTVFLTAFYGLLDLAGLRGGEALLVHGAAGGVGMAALQLAKHLGVEVFATAHPDKWQTLQELGVDDGHVASSRDAGFRERFLEATDGRGVDVVLDSLAGELVDASLDLLPGGGRFIEMGKTDVRDPERVAQEHPGVRYQAFDLAEAGAERIQEMLREIVALFERGVLQHLPVTTFDVRRAPEAFRLMREARHVGKIVLTVPQPADARGTVLITGGTGGLGALLARHLVMTQGARSLLLLSRSGPSAHGAGELQGELEALGARVRIVACDAADKAQLERVLGEIPAECPLSTVIHAAGVLDDGLLSSLTEEHLERVFAPKVDAAVNLHELTEHLELSDFVLYSSAAAILGSPGQGNYAAANAFLDALAGYRRAKELPGLSLAWGAWEMSTSMTQGLSEGDRARFTRLGLAPISDAHGLQLFDAARAVDESWLAPVPLDTSVLRTQAKAGLLPQLLSALVRTPTRRAKDASGSLAARLASAPEAEWEQITLGIVKEHVAAVLGHASPEDIDPTRPFKDLGFDSLSAVELRNRLTQTTGLKLPSTLIFDHPTPQATAQHLQQQAVPESARNVELEPGETVVREALSRIPLSRLRKAGLMDSLMELAESDDDVPMPEEAEDAGEIDMLDTNALVQRALWKQQGEPERQGS